MVAIDNWPQQGTGTVVVPGFDIAFCYVGNAAGVTEGYGITQHGVTGVVGKVVIAVSDAVGDSVGVALKTGAQYDTIPVLFYGVMKLDTSHAVTVGTFVMGASGGATVYDYTITTSSLVVFGGASYVLGYALQAAVTSGDEILVLVGKTM